MSRPSQSDYDHEFFWDCFVEIRDLLKEIRDGLAQRRAVLPGLVEAHDLQIHVPLRSPVVPDPSRTTDPPPDKPFYPPQCTGGE